MQDPRPSAGKREDFFMSTRVLGESVPLYPKGLRPKAAVARDLFLCAFIFTFLILAQPAMAETGTASWYSVESCKREGTWQKYGGKTASGEVFNNENLSCASWDYPFGTNLLVTNIRSKNSILVRVSDRGPAKRLYRMGRIIDLSKAAFAAIAPLEQGIVEVRIEEVK